MTYMTQGGVRMPRIKPESQPLPPPPQKRVSLSPAAWFGILVLVALGHRSPFSVAPHRPANRPRSAVFAHLPTAFTSRRQPPWIRSDIKTQALATPDWSARFGARRLGYALARASKMRLSFILGWPRSSGSTRRLPSSLEVELEYRRPIAAVESSDRERRRYFCRSTSTPCGCPKATSREAERRYLPRISGVTGRPLVGDRWDDPRVVGGAKLAAQLADVWQKLRLVEIIATLQSSPHDEKPVYRYEIVTTGGTRIVWGMTPGEESSLGESPFVQKRQRLLDYAAQHGKLESIDGPAVLDVRSELVVTPRTARHKKAAQKDDATQTKYNVWPHRAERSATAAKRLTPSSTPAADASACSARLSSSANSSRTTANSAGASMPMRTPPWPILTTVTLILSPIRIRSPIFRLRTSTSLASPRSE